MIVALGKLKMTLDQQVEDMARRLQREKGTSVLVYNAFGGNGRPAVFKISSAEVFASTGKSGPFISVRASGDVYELVTDPSQPGKQSWQRDQNDWGRNYFPGKSNGDTPVLAIGRQEIAKALQGRWKYTGPLSL